MIKYFLKTLPGIFCFLIFFASSAYAKDYSFPEVKFQVYLQTDGSAKVEEQRTYRFEGSFHWADLYIIKSQKLKAKSYEITDIKISDEEGEFQQSDLQTANTFFVNDEADRVYLKWFYNAADTTKTFTISYTINNAILVHQDIAEFYWQFVGDQWDKGIDLTEAQIFLPEGNFGKSSAGETDQQKIYGFGHGPLNGKIDIPSNNQVNFRATNLPQKQFFEVRVLFEKDLLTANYQKTASDDITLTQILTEEQKFGQQTELKKKFSLAGLGLGVLIILAAFGLYVFGVIKYLWQWWLLGKDQSLPEVSLSGKLHEPPSDLWPSAVECLLNGKAKISPKAVVAGILDLVNKKLVKIVSENRQAGLLGLGGGYEYKLGKLGDVRDLGDQPLKEKLLKFLFDDCGQGSREVSFDQIKSYARNHRAKAYHFFQDFQKNSFQDCLDKQLFEPASHLFSKRPGNRYFWLGFALTSLVSVAGSVLTIGMIGVIWGIWGNG